jgi:nucleotide-binding universal stress UspA family protein
VKILVPVDGSDNAMRALRHVLDKRDWYRETPEVHLVNVQHPVASGAVKRFISADELRDFYDAEGQAVLQPGRDLLERSGLSFHCRVAVGDTAPTLVQYATEEGCELIVMGTRGLGAVASALLGSVATKVIHLASVPVMLVK